MASPYDNLDRAIQLQLQSYAGVTNYVPSARIRLDQAPITAEAYNAAYDMDPVIWISPTVAAISPFLSAQTSLDRMLYEISIIVPGRDVGELRDIQWGIRRAMSFFMDWKEPDGTAISLEFTPFSQGASRITEFRNILDDDLLRSSCLFEVDLVASEADIQSA